MSGSISTFLGKGLAVLHAMNTVHRELCTRNVLLEHTTKGISVRLSDIGFACLLDEHSIVSDFCGTLSYLAPECVQNLDASQYTKESDMWSLGTILFEMWTGRRAFRVRFIRYRGKKQFLRYSIFRVFFATRF